MRCLFKSIAFGLLAAISASAAIAEDSPAPPSFEPANVNAQVAADSHAASTVEGAVFRVNYAEATAEDIQVATIDQADPGHVFVLLDHQLAVNVAYTAPIATPLPMQERHRATLSLDTGAVSHVASTAGGSVPGVPS